MLSFGCRGILIEILNLTLHNFQNVQVFLLSSLHAFYHIALVQAFFWNRPYFRTPFSDLSIPPTWWVWHCLFHTLGYDCNFWNSPSRIFLLSILFRLQTPRLLAPPFIHSPWFYRTIHAFDHGSQKRPAHWVNSQPFWNLCFSNVWETLYMHKNASEMLPLQS